MKNFLKTNWIKKAKKNYAKHKRKKAYAYFKELVDQEAHLDLPYEVFTQMEPKHLLVLQSNPRTAAALFINQDKANWPDISATKFDI